MCLVISSFCSFQSFRILPDEILNIEDSSNYKLNALLVLKLDSRANIYSLIHANNTLIKVTVMPRTHNITHLNNSCIKSTGQVQTVQARSVAEFWNMSFQDS